ncbi:MAG: 2,3-bisphosphoglycerate-independent phosphoglycerate mutase [Salinivirgaceae bacterium]|nr:2,3-bisphosphoglycerate-independent phosphoglycerate mutase [Salinivirgaceae bacterium]MDD4746327.1 2,3-bisphosphoglycerate-independent phosphoglycerate mutase [Salinivirgaceae bacterium]
MTRKVLLAILDGWGIGDGSKSDVIANTPTPNITKLLDKYPHSQLITCGENVGLPNGQMGNSEVGHLNIGAGRIVFQDLVKINKAIADNSIADNEVIKEAYAYAKKNNKAVHLLGLVSDGGVHSLDKHLYKLCDIAKDHGLENVFIHAFTDGRDTDPRSGLGFIKQLEDHLKTSKGKIASITGRYYAMDRDKRWERIQEAYNGLVRGKGTNYTSAMEAMEASYKNDITDEFIKPSIITDANNKPLATIKEGDVVFCFNYRTDRLRELTVVLTQKDMPEFGMKTIPLHYLTMTRYDDSFAGVNIVYDKDNLHDTLGEVVSKAGLKQLRIAETEKYAHVTFFFSGGREVQFENERRALVSSPKVATYDLQPEMSAYEVRDSVVAELNKGDLSFVCLNFANGDMVGHTGVYKAIQKAIATVDECIGDVVKAARANNFDVIIIADHGNADFAVNADGSANTAHSLNPVPCILVSDTYTKIDNGILADIAPTICKIMGLTTPKLMTGKPLV